MSTSGALSDWMTQQWVQLTGRRVSLAEHVWLDGPIAGPSGVGPSFFHDLGRAQGLRVLDSGRTRGLLRNLDQLRSAALDVDRIHPAVRAFYEQTSDYELDAWSEWRGAFRPFGRLLAILFSRRLQQLNVPLAPLDTSHGTTSEVLHLVDAHTGELQFAAWVRQLRRTGNVLYAGGYSTCRVPGFSGPCIKVVFPLPTGNGIVILKPSVDSEGALTMTSAGHAFGDPGFYFTVHRPGNRVWARYVPVLTEVIRVYPVPGEGVRADHILRYGGIVFLRLHYRLRPRAVTPEEKP